MVYFQCLSIIRNRLEWLEWGRFQISVGPDLSGNFFLTWADSLKGSQG